MGSLKKNTRKGKKSKKYKKYRRQTGGDQYSLDRNIKEINECIWRKKMEKQQRDEEAYRQELLRESTSDHRKEVKEYLYLLPEEDDSEVVVKTFDTMGRIINNDALEEYLKYFDIKTVTSDDFDELKEEIISEIVPDSGETPKGYGNFIRKIDSLTYDGGLEMIEDKDKFGKKGTKGTPATGLYQNPGENEEKIKYVEQLKLFFSDYNKSQYKKFKDMFKLCSDETSDPDSMICQIRDGGLPLMVLEDSELDALLHSMYVSANEVEESYELYASEKKYNFHKIIKEMVVFIIENVYNFEELKAYAKFFIDEKEMFKLFFKYRIEDPEVNTILHVAYAYLTKQTHKTITDIVKGNDPLKDFLKKVNPDNFQQLPEKVLEYWDTQCSSGTKTRGQIAKELNQLKSIHDSMLGCSILNKRKPTSGGSRKKTKKKNKFNGGAGLSINESDIKDILVDIATKAFQQDKKDFYHDSSHDNLITTSYGKEDQNTLEAFCSDGVTVSEKIKSFGKFFLINDKGLPDETVFPNPCGDSFNNTLSFVIDAGSFKQFRPYHKNKCENEENFKTTKNISNYVDPAATGKGDLYRCYSMLSQSGNTVKEQAIDGANRFVKLCVAFTKALILKGAQDLEHNSLTPSTADYKYIFEYLENVKVIDIYKSDLVCLYKNNKERFVWEGNQSPMAAFINSAYDESNTKKIASQRSRNSNSKFLTQFFEKVKKDGIKKEATVIKIGMCRILKYMGDKSHIIACVILILITKKPYIVQTIDRLLSKAIIQVIEYCKVKSKENQKYADISKKLGVMISGGELNKPPKYAQGLPAYSNIFSNNNLDFVTNPYNILFLYFTGDPITAKEGIITEICKNLAEFAQVFTQIENDPQREPYRTIYYVTSMCYRVAGNTYEEADDESLIKGQLEEDLVIKDNSPTDPINISNIISQRDDETQLIQRDDETKLIQRDDETQLIKLGDKLVTAASDASEDEDKEDKLDEFIEALTNEDLFKFMSLYKKVESVKKNKDDFDRLYKKYVENRPGGLNYLLKEKTPMRAPRVSTVKFRVEQEKGHRLYIWNDKKKVGLFPPFTVINPEIRFSEYYKLLSLSFEEPKYGTDDQRRDIRDHCQQLVEYIEALEVSLKDEKYPYDDTLYGVIKLSLGYEDPTPESDGGSLANHRYAITKRFEEGTLTGFVNRAQGFIPSLIKIVELSRNIVNEESTTTGQA